ncbi:Spo0E family sporulation regulatory protein-aspartic acid phosphatase [Halobacillus sp. H74]
MEEIVEEINSLRYQMYEAGKQYGYTSVITVEISQTIDEKLNEYRKLKEE